MFLVPVSRSVRGFDRFFDEALDRFFTETTGARTAPEPTSATAASAARTPALDVIETDDAFTVRLDMPGLAREDIQVNIEDRRVSVSGQSSQSAAATEPREGERLVWRERQAPRYARSFALAADIDQAASSARYENGVLTLTLAKRRPNTSQLAIN